jgi:hypothetical protein
MEKISKETVNIGCHRPEARIERGWEAVCLRIAKDIVTINYRYAFTRLDDKLRYPHPDLTYQQLYNTTQTVSTVN